jgi:hypothetical protein
MQNLKSFVTPVTSTLKQLRHTGPYRVFVTIGVAILLASCAAYGPYHANTSSEPLNSVRGPKDGRYKLAFVEFGDQGSALDASQRTAALRVINETKRPLLFGHGFAVPRGSRGKG